MQFNEGIDAVIVDNVLAVRKGLTSKGKISTSVTPSTAPATPAAADIGDPFAVSKPPITATVNGVPIYANGAIGALHGAVISG
jgi:hypothetical protein